MDCNALPCIAGGIVCTMAKLWLIGILSRKDYGVKACIAHCRGTAAHLILVALLYITEYHQLHRPVM